MKTQANVYSRVNKMVLCSDVKNFSEITVNLFFMYKRLKICHSPKNKTIKIKNKNKTPPGRNVPKKQVFLDRNLQSLIAGHLSETIHFLSNQSISVYLHRNHRQQKGYLLTDYNLPRKVLLLHLDSKQIQNGWQHLCSAGRNP